ncbi:MAG: DUF4180 domain-containing protein [Bacteroidales bacterium]|nr:DUF4180 domain-containing protein [Bacteroidales bacterium]
MNLTIITHNNKTIAQLASQDNLLTHIDDFIDLLGNASYQGATGIIVNETQLSPEFFDLSTRIAGEILQKFSNYRMKLAIVGNFSKFTSKSLKDFIYESNKTGHILFVSTLEEATQRIAG